MPYSFVPNKKILSANNRDITLPSNVSTYSFKLYEFVINKMSSTILNYIYK